VKFLLSRTQNEVLLCDIFTDCIPFYLYIFLGLLTFVTVVTLLQFITVFFLCSFLPKLFFGSNIHFYHYHIGLSWNGCHCNKLHRPSQGKVSVAWIFSIISSPTPTLSLMLPLPHSAITILIWTRGRGGLGLDGNRVTLFFQNSLQTALLTCLMFKIYFIRSWNK
jgi:hypothetical protein